MSWVSGSSAKSTVKRAAAELTVATVSDSATCSKLLLWRSKAACWALSADLTSSLNPRLKTGWVRRMAWFW